jgi:predicted short-subunit dehydrogenase-like oxidoreductase (DUF2520 family)
MKAASVAFIGSGNVAWHLAPALDNVGYAVREVYSRKRKNAVALAERLYQASPVTELDFSNSPARIFIMTVSDDAIAELVKQLTLPPDSVLVHTSGSQPLSLLGDYATPRTGVFYPLQTFTKNRKVDFKEIPFFVEATEAATEKALMSMAKSLTKKVAKITSAERKALHVAAVFASNFTNHMLTLSKEIMINNKLNFDHLKPLIAETLNKSLEIGPENAQTGPARRGDLEILDQHMELLTHDAVVSEIYKLISQHIIDSYGVK